MLRMEILLTSFRNSGERNQEIVCQGKTHFLFIKNPSSLLCPHRAEGMGAITGVSLIRALTPFVRAPLSPNDLTKS